MPIQGGSGGKYNLNWLDDQNEHRYIVNAEAYLAKGECPIYGMDKEVFEAILDEQEYEATKEAYGVKNKFMKEFPIRKATKQSLTKTCAICCNYYQLQQQVFFLPCAHHFHVDCILPWFKKNHKCPTCRYDLNQGEDGGEMVESQGFGDPTLFDL